MSKTIIAAAALSVAAAIVPAVAAEKVPDRTPDQECALHGTMASLIMGLRQFGKPLSEMIQKYPDSRDTIMSAYEYPRYGTKEMQDRAREDFQIDIEKLCFKALSQR